ncbi:hypothetical protein BDZ97DRAFT_1922499 [Flammula alnicola]|nr:hypothetical protein BDZ97DRAFT_1922499 [Flammula alnicola]
MPCCIDDESMTPRVHRRRAHAAGNRRPLHDATLHPQAYEETTNMRRLLVQIVVAWVNQASPTSYLVPTAPAPPPPPVIPTSATHCPSSGLTTPPTPRCRGYNDDGATMRQPLSTTHPHRHVLELLRDSHETAAARPTLAWLNEVCSTIKFQLKKVLGNIMLSIDSLVSLLKKNWQNIKSLHIKSMMGKPICLYA